MAGADRPAVKINEILGIDLGTTSVKLVRLRKNGPDNFTLIEADVMPPPENKPGGKPAPLVLDKKLHTTYAAVCYSGRNAAIRFIDVPAKMATGKLLEGRLRKQLSLGQEFRVGSAIAKEGPADGDHQVLVVAAPETEVAAIRRMIPEERPSILSLEVSGLAALHSFEHTQAAKAPGAVCYIEAGAEVTMVSFLAGGRLALARKFDYGTQHIVARLRELLDLDEENALGLLYGDPAAVASAGEDPMASFIKQLVTSRQFVEKSENLPITACYASGGLSYSPYFMAQIHETLGVPVTIWNPLEENGIKTYPRGLKGVESMFAGAMGAALAILQSK